MGKKKANETRPVLASRFATASRQRLQIHSILSLDDSNPNKRLSPMMKRTLLLLAITLIGYTNQAEARLGETVPQCIERYGPVVEKRPARIDKSDPESCVFSRAGISIIIEYRAGLAWNIRYRTIDLILAQVNELLKANMTEGGGWSGAYEVAGVQYRLATDRRSVAAYDPGKRGDLGILEISSREFNKAWREIYGAKLNNVILEPAQKAGTKELKGF
jgi:hypothetical protein